MSSSVDIAAVSLRVIRIPRELLNRGDKSMFSLLKDSGYFEALDQITKEALQNALLFNRESVRDWLQYSEDKRTTSGFYFKEENPGTYIVGYFPNTARNMKKLIFNNPVIACATFIKSEIEDIRCDGK
jgi:hypothetical protein